MTFPSMFKIYSIVYCHIKIIQKLLTDFLAFNKHLLLFGWHLLVYKILIPKVEMKIITPEKIIIPYQIKEYFLLALSFIYGSVFKQNV